MFVNEEAMHQWIRVVLKSKELSEIVSNFDYLNGFVPINKREEKVLHSFAKGAKALGTRTVVSDNENISLNNKDKLKPDFLMYSPEVEGIVIVELKNIAGPTRQAGTEFGAYAGEVRTYLPFLPEGDLYYVLISTSWPTLLLHYVFHEIFWHGKNVICLEPKPTAYGGSLEIIDIRRISGFETKSHLCEQHMSGFQLCLYDDDRQTCHANFAIDRLGNHRAQMDMAMAMMGEEANQQRAHGFAFLWKDRNFHSLSPYNISIFNFSPFLSLERFLHADDQMLNEIQYRFLNIVSEFSPAQGTSILDIVRAGEEFLETFCAVRIEGSGNWQMWKEHIAERGEFLSFRGWGMFGEALREILKREYKQKKYLTRADDPRLGWQVVGEIFDHEYPFISLY
jgi:hypothetical protein